MDRSDVIKLIGSTYTVNKYGVQVREETERTVFCSVQSVTRSEFFDGGRNGLNPELRFDVFFADYAGEQIVEYNGARFAVYRTYLGKNDTLEIYVERKGGTNGNGA